MKTQKAKQHPYYRIVSQQQNESITIEIINDKRLFDITVSELLTHQKIMNGFSVTDKKIIEAMAEAIENTPA